MEGDSTVLVLEGELDIGVKERARAVFEQACDTRVVVADLRGLTFMDSTGIHLLFEARDRCRATGRTFRLIRGPDTVHRSIVLLGLEREFEFFDEPAAA